jgi:hypothetical protein
VHRFEPRYPLLSTLCAALFTAGYVAAFTPGCHGLTPGEEAAILALDAAVCTSLVPLIPGVGALLASACPGEEAAVKAALDRALVAPEASSAAASALAAPTPPTRRPLFRRISSGRLRHVGDAAHAVHAAVQRELDPTVLPATPAVLPVADGAP